MIFVRSKQQRSRSRWCLFLFSGLTLIISLALLEVAVRGLLRVNHNQNLQMTVRDYTLLAHRQTKGFIPAPYVNYRLQPGYQKISRDGLVTSHNKQGFRDKDFQPKKPGSIRIICLGGSTTYGSGVEDNSQTYPACLEKLLNAGPYRLPGQSRVEVLNLGAGGYTTAEVLANLHFFALPLEPDIILVQSAFNDISPRFYGNFKKDYTHFRKPMQPLDPSIIQRLLYRSKFFLILGWASGVFEPLTLQSQTQYPLPPDDQIMANLKENPPEAYRRNLEAITAAARSKGIQVWLLTQAFLDVIPSHQMGAIEKACHQGLLEHNQVIREMAADESLGLIDLDTTMPREVNYFADPIHMTPEGNQRKAELIAESLKQSLTSPPQ
jgi:lysophospholipase L1-like esterase